MFLSRFWSENADFCLKITGFCDFRRKNYTSFYTRFSMSFYKYVSSEEIFPENLPNYAKFQAIYAWNRAEYNLTKTWNRAESACFIVWNRAEES